MRARLHRTGCDRAPPHPLVLVALPNMWRVPWAARNSEGYEAPAALATDVVVLTVRDEALVALAITRDGEQRRALPGGFVGAGERPLDTALRKLHEKTGLLEPYVEQLGAFADPGRDPRGWIPSIAYLALVPARHARPRPERPLDRRAGPRAAGVRPRGGAGRGGRPPGGQAVVVERHRRHAARSRSR